MIGRWLSLLTAQAAWRVLSRCALLAVAAAVVIAAAPVSLVAACGVAAAWRQGWRPVRLYLAAAWCAPMVVVWLAATAAADGWAAAGAAPYRAWRMMWQLGTGGHIAAAAGVVAPAAIPLGLLAAGLAWSYRIRAMEAGSGGLSPASGTAFDRRQWQHQARSARARIAAPGALPVTTPGGDLQPGAVIRAVGHRWRPMAVLPYQRMRSHQVVIGTTGTGKTTLLLRLWAGFVTAVLQRHAAGAGPRPLLVVLDCKGGADARKIADRTRRVLRDAGARVAVWPDDAGLSLWELAPDQLITTLVDLIEHGTGGAAYYADVMEAVVSLAVRAPCGPPRNTADFLARLERGWLTAAYPPAQHPAEEAMTRSAGRQIGDIALRYRTLFRRLGPGLDGPGSFDDADAWYCILEGTAEISVAEAQARALTDLLAHYATGRGSAPAAGRRREILLSVDEFSAVSRRLPVWQLYERARSLGLAVQVSAQSWQGLAADEDERYRIAAAADGGIWLLRTPHPEPVAALAGGRTTVDTTRRLLGIPVWAHRGSSRTRQVPVVDPALIRRLRVGQVAYVYRGGVTYIEVKRVVAAPAALTGIAGQAHRRDAETQATAAVLPAAPGLAVPQTAASLAGPAKPGGQPLPDVSALLDQAFGAEAPQ